VDITEKFNYLNASLQAGLLSRCRKESGVFGGVRVGFSIKIEVGFFIRLRKSNWIITSHSWVRNTRAYWNGL